MRRSGLLSFSLSPRSDTICGGQTMQPLSYESPGTARPSLGKGRVWACIAGVAAVIIAVNAFLLVQAAADRSWGALYIMLITGPMTNGVLVLLSLAFALVVK